MAEEYVTLKAALRLGAVVHTQADLTDKIKRPKWLFLEEPWIFLRSAVDALKLLGYTEGKSFRFSGKRKVFSVTVGGGKRKERQ